MFKLKLKGEMPELAEVKQDPTMMRKDSEGAPVSPEKKVKAKPCEIDASLAERIKAGAVTSTIPSEKAKDKNSDIVFKLSLKGPQPKISEVRKDPNEAMANAAAEKEAEQQKIAKTPCIIDVSLGERIKAGAV